MARYTSACPGYFTEFDNYVDGGVLANNPSEHGLTRIHKFYTDQGQPLNISCVVSVGTGIFPDREVGNTDLTSLLLGKPLHMVENAKNMLDLLTHAVSFQSIFQAFSEVEVFSQYYCSVHNSLQNQNWVLRTARAAARYWVFPFTASTPNCRR